MECQTTGRLGFAKGAGNTVSVWPRLTIPARRSGVVCQALLFRQKKLNEFQLQEKVLATVDVSSGEDGTIYVQGGGSFDQVGVPGFQFVQDELDYMLRTHHTNMDVQDKVAEADLKQAAVIVASFVAHAANRAPMLPRKPLPPEPPKTPVPHP